MISCARKRSRSGCKDDQLRTGCSTPRCGAPLPVRCRSSIRRRDHDLVQPRGSVVGDHGRSPRRTARREPGRGGGSEPLHRRRMLAAGRLLAGLTHELEPDRVDLIGIDRPGVAVPRRTMTPRPSTRRRCETSACSAFAAFAGWASPHSSSTSRPSGTGCGAAKASRASTDCSLVPAIGTTSLPTPILGWSEQCDADRAVHSRPSPQWVPEFARLLREPTRRLGHHAVSGTSALAETMHYGVGVDAVGKRRRCRPTSRRSRAIASASPPSCPALATRCGGSTTRDRPRSRIRPGPLAVPLLWCSRGDPDQALPGGARVPSAGPNASTSRSSR